VAAGQQASAPEAVGSAPTSGYGAGLDDEEFWKPTAANVVRWAAMLLIVGVVMINAAHKTKLAYAAVPLALALAISSPAGALAASLLAAALPGALGNTNIGAQLPTLLLGPVLLHGAIGLASGARSPRRPLALLALMALIVFVADATHKSPQELVDYAPRYQGLVVLLGACATRWRPKDRTFLLQVILLAGGALAVSTIVRLRGHAGTETAKNAEMVLRGVADGFDPNYCACWLGSAILSSVVLAADLFLVRKKLVAALFWLAPSAVCLAAMGLCASRGMFLALMLAGGTMFLTTPVSWAARLRLCAGAAAVLVAAGLAGSFKLLIARFQEGDIGDGDGRLQIWAWALGVFARLQPWEKAVGGGSERNFAEVGWSTHNNYLDCLLDYGVVGLLCFACFVTVLLVGARRLSWSLRLPALAFLVFLALACASLVPLMYEWGWVVLALVVVCVQAGNSADLAPGTARPVAARI